MTDTTDLIRRLREADADSAQRIAGGDIFAQAVDRIAELEAERGWQTIETAPKDGARVLLAKFGWAEDMEGNNEYRLFFAVSGSWWTERDCWTDGLEKLIPPTHWMPLPAPPQDTEGDG